MGRGHGISGPPMYATPYRCLSTAPTYPDLVTGQPVAVDPAGDGPRLDRSRRGERAWRAQVQAWGLRMPADPSVRRVWRVVVREEKRRALARSLPSGKYLRVFANDGDHVRKRSDGDGRDGPLYELPWSDAAALWRDKYLVVSPACETYVISPGYAEVCDG